MSAKKGYWIAMLEVLDAESYLGYVEANGPVFARYGAKPLARGGRHENPEGFSGTRHVILEFESYDQALACYRSPEYQEAVKIRLANSTGRFTIVEGV